MERRSFRERKHYKGSGVCAKGRANVQVSAKGPELQVKEAFEYEIEKISGSRFLTLLLPAPAPELVIEMQQQLRSAHPHSRHVCFAYVGATETATRHSDDGEPAKTAGMPMLRVLVGASLRNTGALVVRYFGGVKLGTGGLVRAYTKAVREAVEHAPLVPVAQLTNRDVRVGYADEPKVRHWCERYGVTFDVVEYGATDVTATLRGESTAVNEVCMRLDVS